MAGWLARFDVGAASAERIDPEVRSRLEALGYVGGGAPAPAAGAALADPKDKLAAYEAYRNALSLRRSGDDAGSLAALKDNDEVIGKVVRTRTDVKPLYVSVGHRIDLASAVRVVLSTCRGYRIPEPTRQAHLLVNELRRRAGDPAHS